MNVWRNVGMAGVMTVALWSAHAQMTPVGLWRSIDDDTGEARAEIEIVDRQGVLFGRVAKSLDPDPKAVKTCEACKDERKDQAIVGMEIIRGVRHEPDDKRWGGGGKILDPENGKEYTVRMVPLDGGKRLQLRGYIGPFYRTQIWQRIQ